MDAPQQGAYISYAVQYIGSLALSAAFIADLFFGTKYFDFELYQKFFSPCTSQMLVYYYPECNNPSSPAPSTMRAQLISDFNSLGNNGYPTTVDKMVAFSFGSGQGQDGLQGFNPSEIRFQYYGDPESEIVTNLHVVDRALPDNTGTTILEFSAEVEIDNPCRDWGILKIICGWQKKLRISVELSDLTVSGTLPYESAPGSYQTSTEEFAVEINKNLGTEISLNYPQDCFIPTISALNLLNVPLTYNVLGSLTGNENYYEVNNSSITPFDAIYVENENKIHDRDGVTGPMMDKAFKLILPVDLTVENLTISNQKKQYEAENSITVQNVTIQNNSSVVFRAGQSITFESNVNIGTGWL